MTPAHIRPTRRALLLGGAALALGAAACSPADGPAVDAELTPVTVGLSYIPNVQFSAFYVGVADGIFADAGLDVTIRHHGAQEDVFGALVSGTEDVVFASSDEAMVASIQTPDLRTFATAYQRFPGVVVVPAESGITSVADLAGHSLGIPGQFGSTWYATLAALHTAGLTPDDVDVTDIGFTQVAALSTGKVDAIVGYANNEPVQFSTAGFDVVEFPVQDPEAPSLVGPGLITMDGRLDVEVLQGLAEGMAEAERRILADPAVALEATKQHVPTLADPDQLATAEAVLAATSELWLADGVVSVAVDEEAFVRMAVFLAEVGIIDSEPGEQTITW